MDRQTDREVGLKPIYFTKLGGKVKIRLRTSAISV